MDKIKKKSDRQYAYLTYKDKYPMQLKGNMKKHIKNEVYNGQSWNKFMDKTSDFKLIKDPKRKDVAKKMVENMQTIRTIIPSQNKQNTKIQSKKILNHEQQRNFSGAYYLIQKSSKKTVSHTQKRHIRGESFQKPLINQRKHFQNQNSLHYKQQSIPKVRNRYSTITKIQKDLKSSIAQNSYSKKQTQETKQRTRRNSMNLFKQSCDSGLQRQKIKVTSKQKIKQMIGNGLDKQSLVNKSRRDDFRRSSIIFG